MSIELYNEVALLLNLEILFVKAGASISVVKGDKIHAVEDPNKEIGNYVKLTNYSLRGTEYYDFCGPTRVVHDTTRVVFVKQANGPSICYGWHGEVNFCPFYFTHKEPIKKNPNIDFGLLEEKLDNGVWVPHKYIARGCTYGPEQWARLPRERFYVPADTVFPCNITMPSGAVFYCKAIEDVPGENVSVVWAVKNNIRLRPGSHSAKAVESYMKYLDDIKKWNAAHYDLANCKITICGIPMRLTERERVIFSEMLYKNTPMEYCGYIWPDDVLHDAD